MSNEKVSLGGYQKISSELKETSYANPSMQVASQAIEELNLDEVAFDALSGMISSNAADAASMDFISGENIQSHSDAWTDGTLTFEKRDDGTYKILKVVDGVEEPIVMGFTNQEGVEAYYAALESVKDEASTNSNVDISYYYENANGAAELNYQNQPQSVSDQVSSGSNNNNVSGSNVSTNLEIPNLASIVEEITDSNNVAVNTNSETELPNLNFSEFAADVLNNYSENNTVLKPSNNVSGDISKININDKNQMIQ